MYKIVMCVQLSEHIGHHSAYIAQIFYLLQQRSAVDRLAVDTAARTWQSLSTLMVGASNLSGVAKHRLYKPD